MSDDAFQPMTDQYLNTLTRYLFAFPDNAWAAWKIYTEVVLRASSVAQDLAAFADALDNVKTSSACVEQSKKNYVNVKAVATDKYKDCLDRNVVQSDTFYWDAGQPVDDVRTIDNTMNGVMERCEQNGMDKAKCEELYRDDFMALRKEAREKHAMPLYNMRIKTIVDNGKILADCIAYDTTELIDEIKKDVEFLNDCLSGKHTA